jgi:hypothetical protein
MSTATYTPTRTTTSAPTPGAERQPVWKHGVASAVMASVATTVLAAIASAAGVSFADNTGASIPIAGFAQLTLAFSLVGVGIAAVMARQGASAAGHVRADGDRPDRAVLCPGSHVRVRRRLRRHPHHAA